MMLSDNQPPDLHAAGIHEENLLLKIWLQPRATLHFILQNCPTKHVTLLLLLGGIARMLGRIDHAHPLPPNAVVVAGVIGSLSGWIFFYFYAWGLRMAGKLLRGSADFATLETVVAWALVPLVVSIPLSLLLLDADTKAYVVAAGLPLRWLATLVMWGQFVLAVWSLIILVKGIRLVQGFSIGKSLLNVLVPGGMVLLLIGALLLLEKLVGTASL